jgi:DNA repair exonuclease SbcCD ATPase subunit
MLRQELNTYQKQQQLEKNRRDFNSRINQILNNQNHHQILPTTNEVEIIEKVSSEFENLKSQNLTEIRRFLNISTQIAQLNKSKTNLDKVNSSYQKVKSVLSSLSKDDTPDVMMKKLSSSIILLSDMLLNSTNVSRSNTISSVSNSILTRDVSKKVDNLTKKRR